MSTEEQISKAKVTKFLYENAVNSSMRKYTPPSVNDKIILKNKLPKIDYYNFGFVPDTREWSIRVRFHGSEKWYEVKVTVDDVDDWFSYFKQQSEYKKKSMFSAEDSEDDW